MKMVKSLLLGSAAGLVAVAGAQAADLPVKAKAVEYVKVCSLYGAGFYYIPGTDTCIKIGGYVRFEAYHNNVGAHMPYMGSSEAAYTRHTDTHQTRARGMFSMDVRSQTEYGTLRSYMRFGQQNTSDVGGKAINMERAFIQFAGFTFGLTDSYFDFYNGAAYGFTPQFANSAVGPAGINVAAYTAQFGNGVSASISLEDRKLRSKGVADMNAPNNLFGANFAVAAATAAFTPSSVVAGGFGVATDRDAAGTRMPDLVGNIRVDQAWGSAQIMGALHEVRGRYFRGPAVGSCVTTGGAGGAGPVFSNADSNTCGAPGDEWGWAVGAGLTLKMPWDPKDTLSFQVAYTEGAVAYAGQGLTNVYIHKSGGLALAPVADSIFANPTGIAGYNGQQELTEAWSVTASFEHYWTPTLRTSVTGQYIALDYNQSATNLICGALTGAIPGSGFGGGVTAGTFTGTCNPDSKIWQIASRTLWNPVANLDVGLEIAYTKIESEIQGIAVVSPGNGLANASPYALGDQEFWSANFRVQRNFWP